MVGCGQTSAKWLPSTMPSPRSTGPNGLREKRSSAFVREDSGEFPQTQCGAGAKPSDNLRLVGNSQVSSPSATRNLGEPGRSASDPHNNYRFTVCHFN